MLPIENTFIMVPDKCGYDRWKTMENLQLGEEVYTYDIKTGTIGTEKITSILMHPYYHYAHKNLYEVNGIIGTENQKYVSIPGTKPVNKKVNGDAIINGATSNYLKPIEELKLVLYVLGMQQLVVRVDDGRYGIYIESIKELNKPLYHYLKNLVHLITEYGNQKPVITYEYEVGEDGSNKILYLTFLQDKYSDIDFTERLNLTSDYLIEKGSTVVDILLSVSKSLIGETYIKTKTYTEAQNIQDLCILCGGLINGTSSGTPWNSVIYYSEKFECYIIKFLDKQEIENRSNLQLTSVVPLDITERYEGKYFGAIGINYGDTKKLIVKQLFYCNSNTNDGKIISESDLMVLE